MQQLQKILLIFLLMFGVAFALVVSVATRAAVTVNSELVSEPREVVVAATQYLLTVVKDKQSQIQKDKTVAESIADQWIDPYLDYHYLARTVLGKHWRTASQARKNAFSEAFRGFVRRTYVAALHAYTVDIVRYGETMRYPSTPYKVKGSLAEVRAEVSLPASRVIIDFRLHYDEHNWKIFDVTVEGVSLALTYRKQFAEEIKQVGLDGLTQRLSQHNARFN